MNKNVIIALAGLGLIVLLFIFFKKTNQAEEPTAENQTSINSDQNAVLSDRKYSSPPEIFLKPDKNYLVELETNFGLITIELFHNEVPVAANNFAFLAKEEFYDGLNFHRVVKDFMIQGGDPEGNGTGGPGYQFADEPVNRAYDRSIVAYANSGTDTNGSQFFIMHQDYDLPPHYVIFGQVVDGIEVIDKITDVDVEINYFGEPSQPTEPVLINKAKLIES